MRFFRTTLVALLASAASSAVVNPALGPAIGPIAPSADSREQLKQAMHLLQQTIDTTSTSSSSPSLDKDLRKHIETVLRLQQHQQLPVDNEDDTTPHGFATSLNTGEAPFMPYLPDSNIPSARMIDVTMEPDTTEDPVATVEPTTTPFVPSTPTPPPNGTAPTIPPATLPVPSEAPAVTSPPAGTSPGVGTVPTPPEETEEPVASASPAEPGVDGEFPTDESVVPGLPPGGLFPTDEIDPSPTDDDDNVCFPAEAHVELEDGSLKMMHQLQLGDKVRVGQNAFSEVFMFTHRLADVKHAFLRIATASGAQLSLTKSHYLYVNDALVAAQAVKEGDRIVLANGMDDLVVGVNEVFAKGLYNPQTVHGDIVVNGVLASTYTKSINPPTAHAFLAPLRAVYEHVGYSLAAFEAGAGFIANLLPSGPLSM